MPIISQVEANSRRGKVIYSAIFLVLTLGGLTMLYPFMIMLSGSVRSEMDETDLDLVPRYLMDTDVLYLKFVETKYNQDVQALNRSHGRLNFSFRDAMLPPRVEQAQVADLHAFMSRPDLPLHWQVLGGAVGMKTVPENLRRLQDRLERHFEGDLAAFSREIGAPVTGWNTIVLPSPDWLTQRFDYQDNSLYRTYFELLQEAPIAERQLVSITGHFLDTMIFPVYGQSVEAFNEAHDRRLEEFGDLVLPRTVPAEDDPRLRGEWIEFVRQELNPSFVLLEGVSLYEWHEFLGAKYGSIANLNENWRANYPAYEAIELPAGQYLGGMRRQDYLEFLVEQPPETYRLMGPEYAWRDWLAERYNTVETLSAAHHTRYAAFEQARPPMDQLEYRYVEENAASLRWTFATRNFAVVVRELVLQGRTFINTVIFCTLAVVVALLINPLAAYALSRFKLPGTYKILLLLMVTMAFPPMVTLIPTFIILREANLLNSFFALIVPFAANGYMIFLLKGFFDSLPQELYEAARIDGASEIRMFFQITLALSKPILAVVALGAFTSAYTMFLYALIVNPRQDMWILNVWLYQWQNTASMSSVFASVLVACIPTLLVFIFAQNVIMRGIVVPVEK